MHIYRLISAVALVLTLGWQGACAQESTAAKVAAGNTNQIAGSDEYALIGYNQEATHNRVARLAAKLASGEVKLEYGARRGYFDSLLQALEIDPHSQTLVFSKTSLQYPLIDGEKPRGVYFNDDTYVGFVQHSQVVEITTMDDKLGAVFYVFHNVDKIPQPIERQTPRCLVCHDSNGASGGGGIPLVLAQSSIYSKADTLLQEIDIYGNINDKTPLERRWGGWFVSGHSGKQKHLGNVRLDSADDLPKLDKQLRLNVPTLAGSGIVDVSPYIVPTSDIAALLVLEHQLTVQNQLTYVRFKGPAVLARNNVPMPDASLRWAELPAATQKLLTRMLNELVKVLLFADAAPYADTIKGSAEFQANFEAQGPKDAEGRSLRQLDLQRQLLKHPLSYLIYSTYFESLPVYAKDYVYQQLAAILEGRKKDAAFKALDDSERSNLIGILRATKPEFVAYLSK